MSKFHEIDVKGKLWVQRVNDISLQIHNEDDKGRILYDKTTKRLCYGTGVGWQYFNNKYDIIPQNTKILMGRYPLPAGWNIVLSVNDRCVILTSTVVDIGTVGGSWKISGLLAVTGHDHGGFTGRYYKDTGTVTTGTDDSYGHVGTVKHVHSISMSTDQHFHGFDEQWRPYHNKYCIAKFA